MSGDMFGGGGAKQTGTSQTIQKSEPWSGQQPYLTEGFERAKTDVLNSPTQTYPNSTVVPFSPQTQLALNATQQRAMMGSPVQDAGNQAMLDTIGGNYLMAENPYFQSAVDAASRGAVRNFQTAVQPGVDSTFSSAGRYGSGSHQTAMETAYNALGQQLSDTAGKMAYQNYGDERGRQMTAAAGAPAYAMQDYNDMTRMLGVGQAYEGQAGAQLGDDISRFYQDQQSQKQALADYMALVAGGNFGGTTTTQQPIYASGGGGLSGLLSLGMMGAGLMSGMGGATAPNFIGGSQMPSSFWAT